MAGPIILTASELAAKKRHGYWHRGSDGAERVVHFVPGLGTVLARFELA